MDFEKLEKMTDAEINKLYENIMFISGNVYHVDCDNGLSGNFHDVFYYSHPIGSCSYGTDCYSKPPADDKAICHICGIAQYGRACVIQKV